MSYFRKQWTGEKLDYILTDLPSKKVNTEMLPELDSSSELEEA